jgi:glycosyltransferase involved in cell wall biosynthesis
MNDNKITIIFTYRNREVGRIGRCLTSLEKQTFKKFSVIFIDYGSNEEYSLQLKNLLSNYSFCEYVYTETKGYPWNKSKALNIAIKKVETEFTLICDVDIIFPKDYLEKIILHSDKKKVIFPYTYFLPNNYNVWDSIENNIDKFEIGTKYACGIHCVSSKILKDICGYDEYYYFWGVEDRDMRLRYNLLGLEEIWDKNIFHFHQWHPVFNHSTIQHIPDGLWNRMQRHFYQNYSIPIRNTNIDWGKILTKSERSVYKFIDFNNNKLLKNDQLTIVDLPIQPESGGRFIEYFYESKSNNALAVPNYNFPSHFKILDFILKWENRIFRKTGKTELDYRHNYLFSTLFEIIHEDSNSVSDYYLGFIDREYNGLSIIVKK